MIKNLHSENAKMTSLLRLVAWVMMVLGLYLLFSPVITLLKFIPLVGWLLGGIVAIAAGIFAAVIGTILHLLTMAIAWIFYRPLFGISLLFCVAILITVLFTVGKK